MVFLSGHCQYKDPSMISKQCEGPTVLRRSDRFVHDIKSYLCLSRDSFKEAYQTAATEKDQLNSKYSVLFDMNIAMRMQTGQIFPYKSFFDHRITGCLVSNCIHLSILTVWMIIIHDMHVNNIILNSTEILYGSQY